MDQVRCSDCERLMRTSGEHETHRKTCKAKALHEAWNALLQMEFYGENATLRDWLNRLASEDESRLSAEGRKLREAYLLVESLYATDRN